MHNNFLTSRYAYFLSRTAACITGSVTLSRWLDRNGDGLAPIFLRILLAYEFGEAGLE